MNESQRTPRVPPPSPGPGLVTQAKGLAALYGCELYLGPWFLLTDAEKDTQMAAHRRTLAEYELRYRPASTLVAAVLQASQEPLPT